MKLHWSYQTWDMLHVHKCVDAFLEILHMDQLKLWSQCDMRNFGSLKSGPVWNLDGFVHIHLFGMRHHMEAQCVACWQHPCGDIVMRWRRSDALRMLHWLHCIGNNCVIPIVNPIVLQLYYCCSRKKGRGVAMSFSSFPMSPAPCSSVPTHFQNVAFASRWRNIPMVYNIIM